MLPLDPPRASKRAARFGKALRSIALIAGLVAAIALRPAPLDETASLAHDPSCKRRYANVLDLAALDDPQGHTEPQLRRTRQRAVAHLNACLLETATRRHSST